MYTYECLIKFGHMGAGQSLERSVRIKANSPMEAMRRAKRLPGAKKGRSGPAVMRVSLIP
jgi:hypothetical protein